jgi:hypothetical protein
MWQHNYLQLWPNSHILITCDNTYTLESKDEFILVDLFFIQYPLSFAINTTCNLSKAINGILVTNVAYN